VIQVFIIAITIFVSTAVVVVTLWFWPHLVAWLFPTPDEPTPSAYSALAQAEVTPVEESTIQPQWTATAENTAMPTVTLSPIAPDTPTPINTDTPEPTFTLTPSPTATSAPTPTPAAELFCTSAPGRAFTDIRLRSGPYASLNASNDLGNVSRGDSVQILAKHTSNDGLFYEIITSDGRVGWVPATICVTDADISLVLQKPVESVPTRLPLVQTQSPATNNNSGVSAPQKNISASSGITSEQTHFRVSVTPSCDADTARTWFDGKVYVNGEPANGYKIWFGSELGGVTLDQVSGPHEDHWNWPTGYYEHIVDDPRRSHVKHLRIWIADSTGNQVSDSGYWETTCSYARIDFYAP